MFETLALLALAVVAFLWWKTRSRRRSFTMPHDPDGEPATDRQMALLESLMRKHNANIRGMPERPTVRQASAIIDALKSIDS